MEQQDARVKLSTSKGNIIIRLYNDTPKHKDNFIKLVKEGVYEGTLFHRVIKDFMVQAGDPTSKNAAPGQMLGTGDVGYTIPAEFMIPTHYHKKGVLSAARQGDDVNPERASSGCQFYIVTGRTFNEKQLKNMEQQMEQAQLQNVFNGLARKHMKEIFMMRKKGDQNGLIALQNELEKQAREMAAGLPSVKFTEQQVNDYTTVGGTPHLDGQYTVFGEVEEGMDVVEAIQNVKTDRADRPEEDVLIVKAELL